MISREVCYQCYKSWATANEIWEEEILCLANEILIKDEWRCRLFRGLDLKDVDNPPVRCTYLLEHAIMEVVSDKS